MQACYVVESKGDFLRLAAYKPGQNLRRGNKMSIDAAEELGWVHKNNLLLWSNSLREKGTNYDVKAITALGGERIFTSLPGHVSGDSLITFANPALNEPFGKTAMGELFYIYKTSASGNEYLVGPEPGFLPDSSASSGLCWVSKDLMRVWGTTTFLSVNNSSPADNKINIPFYESAPGGTKPPSHVLSSENTTLKSEFEKLMPLWEIRNNGPEKTFVRTAVLTDVMDRKQNEVRNVLGSIITYDKYRKIVNDNANLNIVFVVDGGTRNAQYINQLLNIIESQAWQKLAGSKFRQINYGSVFYRDNLKNCTNAVSPIHSDIKMVTTFIESQQKMENSCDDKKPSQAVFTGLADAARLLSSNPDHNNIVVLFGGDGDVSNNAKLGQVISSLSYVNAKLLVFQTYSIGNAINNNFVIQGRQIMQKTADNIVEMKKAKMVSYSSSPLNASEFAPLEAETNIQMLDFPAKSMTQGIIVFPKRGEIMVPRLLETSLTRLISQISEDNIALEKSLSLAFATQGSRGTTINPSFAWLFPQSKASLPEEYLRANTLRNQDFLVPGWVAIGNDSFEMNDDALSSVMLLNYSEYQKVVSKMNSLVSGANTKKAIVKYLQAVAKKHSGKQAWGTSKGSGSLTFSEIMALVTGYYPMDSVWMNTTLSAFKSNKRIPVEIGTIFFEQARNKHTWLQDNINNPNIRFTNNGRVYYLIGKEYLPKFTSDILQNIQPVAKPEHKNVERKKTETKDSLKEKPQKAERKAKTKAKKEAAETIPAL